MIRNLSQKQLDVMKILWDAGTPLVASDIVKAESSMNINTVQASLRDLIKENQIEKADIAYNQKDAPYLDDAAYDKLRRLNDALEAKFPALIRNDSPSKRVGAMKKSEFKKVELSVPMLSLADIFSEEELKDFIMSIKRFLNSSADIIFTSEPKMDGLSFSALYVNGIFTRESTR